MKRHGYIFTNKKHPLMAIMSTVLGGISILSFVYAIIRSFIWKGDVPARFGAGGMLAFIYSLVGIILALYSFKVKDVFRLFSVIGLVLNLLSLLAAGFILWIPD